MAENRAAVKPVKIIVAGNQQTGKTMFLRRWKDPDTIAEPKPTIGTDLICESYVSPNGKRYTVQVWDTAGQEAYHSITAPYFRNANGVILVFDLTNPASFQALGYWLDLVQENAQNDPVIVVVGNKCDLEREVPDSAIEQWCVAHDCVFFITSAITGENVAEAVQHLITEVVKRQECGIVFEQDAATVSLTGRSEGRSGCC